MAVNTSQTPKADGTRNKSSDLTNVLPPVSELLGTGPSEMAYVDLDGVTRTLNFRQHAERDPYPLPMPVDREGYGTVATSARFWATGLGDWLNVQEAFHRYAQPVGAPATPATASGKLLDFGCATGRFLRHVWADPDRQFEPWGCDFAPQNVAWVKTHLPSEMRVILNHSWPHLPFADGFFDLVTAFSVFTHIDQFEDAWLLELGRITRPGGLLYVTIQNEATWSRVADRPSYIDHLSKANQFQNPLTIDAAAFSQSMPQDRIALRMAADDVYNCNVWQSSQYVLDNWSRFFDILQIANNAHTMFQSVVVMRPRSSFRNLAGHDGPDIKRVPR